MFSQQNYHSIQPAHYDLHFSPPPQPPTPSIAILKMFTNFTELNGPTAGRKRDIFVLITFCTLLFNQSRVNSSRRKINIRNSLLD